MFTIDIAREADGPAHFDVQVALEGATYTLEFRWNVRLGAWFMALLDSQGTTPIAVGLRLVANWYLDAYSVGGPPGRFAALDTSNLNTDPGFDDLGTRVQIVYSTAAELGL